MPGVLLGVLWGGPGLLIILFDSVASGTKGFLLIRFEANSTITVNDGQIAILAGLQQNEISDTGNYFPFIGRLPLIKQVLSGTSKSYNRTELVIFIRPTIIRNPNQSEQLTLDILENYEEGATIEKYIDTGTIRETYMQGSRLSPKIKRPNATNESNE